MVALRVIKNRAELRRHTSLALLRANATRWNSTFMMLERYVRIRDVIKRIDTAYDLVPKPAAHRRIVAIVESLKTFNGVCKKLQEESISMKADDFYLTRWLKSSLLRVNRRRHRPFSGV
ncbi:hypothetical protein PI124_g5171 [Phytophthora idaei]|nr:hypothetical protein PI125_g5765 [Phytophthora idaei]KAG3163588.1 hypothetical protein PI126_g5455 [Phytophthora idaei]KAG3250181.1 hypothetical protein PI124_g5171 [Phytophthora idaei]